jgi:hypothetical protein
MAVLLHQITYESVAWLMSIWLMSDGYMFDNVLFYHFVAVIINLHYSHSAIILSCRHHFDLILALSFTIFVDIVFSCYIRKSILMLQMTFNVTTVTYPKGVFLFVQTLTPLTLANNNFNESFEDSIGSNAPKPVALCTFHCIPESKW